MSGDIVDLDPTLPPPLPARPADGHKGTFGTVVVLGGCAADPTRMIGAPAFAALGALRSGAGLCRVLAPAPVLPHVLTICPSATGLALPTDAEGRVVPHEAARLLDDALAGAMALAIGPGLGGGDEIEAVVLRAVAQDVCPVVADADALHALAALARSDGGALPVRAPTVLTPHPGEFRVVAEALGVGADPVPPASRPSAAAALARRAGCVVVLKGRGTVVSDGRRTWVCDAGTSALATAGTGDVLAGVITGLIAQHAGAGRSAAASSRAGLAGGFDLYDCARIAVRAHALAGEAWARRARASAGLLAHELADELPALLRGSQPPV